MQRPFYSNPPIEEELCEFRFKPDQDEERKQARLVNKLHAAFEAEPLEDGMHHKAEDIIGQVLQSREDQRILEWLRAFSLDDTKGRSTEFRGVCSALSWASRAFRNKLMAFRTRARCVGFR